MHLRGPHCCRDNTREQWGRASSLSLPSYCNFSLGDMLQAVTSLSHMALKGYLQGTHKIPKTLVYRGDHSVNVE